MPHAEIRKPALCHQDRPTTNHFVFQHHTARDDRYATHQAVEDLGLIDTGAAGGEL